MNKYIIIVLTLILLMLSIVFNFIDDGVNTWRPSREIPKHVAHELRQLDIKIQRHRNFLERFKDNQELGKFALVCKVLAQSEYFQDAFTLKSGLRDEHLLAQVARYASSKDAMIFRTTLPWIDFEKLSAISEKVASDRGLTGLTKRFDLSARYQKQICGVIGEGHLKKESFRVAHSLAKDLVALPTSTKDWLGINTALLDAWLIKFDATLEEINQPLASRAAGAKTNMTSEQNTELYLAVYDATNHAEQIALKELDTIYHQFQEPLAAIHREMGYPTDKSNFSDALAVIVEQGAAASTLYQLLNQQKIQCNDTNELCRLTNGIPAMGQLSLTGNFVGNPNSSQVTGAAIDTPIKVQYDTQTKTWRVQKEVELHLGLSIREYFGAASSLKTKLSESGPALEGYYQRDLDFGIFKKNTLVELVNRGQNEFGIEVDLSTLSQEGWRSDFYQLQSTMQELGVPKYIEVRFESLDFSDSAKLLFEFSVPTISEYGKSVQLHLTDVNSAKSLRQAFQSASKSTLSKTINAINKLDQKPLAPLWNGSELPEDLQFIRAEVMTLNPLGLRHVYVQSSSGIEFVAQSRLSSSGKLEIIDLQADAESALVALGRQFNSLKEKNVSHATETANTLENNIMRELNNTLPDESFSDIQLIRKIQEQAIESAAINSISAKNLIAQTITAQKILQDIPQYAEYELQKVSITDFQNILQQADLKLLRAINQTSTALSHLPEQCNNSDMKTVFVNAMRKQTWQWVDENALFDDVNSEIKASEVALVRRYHILKDAITSVLLNCDAPKRAMKGQTLQETEELQKERAVITQKMFEHIVNQDAALRESVKDVRFQLQASVSALLINDTGKDVLIEVLQKHCSQQDCTSAIAQGEQLYEEIVADVKPKLIEALRDDAQQWLLKPEQIPEYFEGSVVAAIEDIAAIPAAKTQRLQMNLETFYNVKSEELEQKSIIPAAMSLSNITTAVNETKREISVHFGIAPKGSLQGVSIEASEEWKTTISLNEANSNEAQKAYKNFKAIEELVTGIKEQKKALKNNALAELNKSLPLQLTCKRLFPGKEALCQNPEIFHSLDAYAVNIAAAALETARERLVSGINKWNQEQIVSALEGANALLKSSIDMDIASCANLSSNANTDDASPLFKQLVSQIPNVDNAGHLERCLTGRLQQQLEPLFQAYVAKIQLELEKQGCDDEFTCKQKIYDQRLELENMVIAEAEKMEWHVRKALLRSLGVIDEHLDEAIIWSEQLTQFTNEVMNDVPNIALKMGEQICLEQLSSIQLPDGTKALCDTGQDPAKSLSSLLQQQKNMTKVLLDQKAEMLKTKIEDDFMNALEGTPFDYNNGDPRVCLSNGKCYLLSQLQDPKQLFKNEVDTLKDQLKKEVDTKKQEVENYAKEELAKIEDSLKKEAQKLCDAIQKSNLSILGQPIDIDDSCPPSSSSIRATFTLFDEVITVESGLKVNAAFDELELDFQKLTLTPNLESVLSKRIEEEVEGLSIKHATFKNQVFNASIRYQPPNFPLPVDAEVTLDKWDAVDVKIDFKKVLVTAIVKEFCSAVGEQIDQFDLVPETKLTNFRKDVCLKSESFETIKLQFDATTLNSVFPVVLPIELSVADGLKVGPPDLGSLLGTLSNQWPFEMIYPDNPLYSLDGGVEIYLVADVKPVALDLSIKAAMTIGKSIKFRGPITLKLPGWYDAPPISLGNLGATFDLEKNVVGLNAAVTLSPGTTTQNIIKINGSGQLGLKDFTFQMQGDLVLANVLSVASSEVLVDIPEHLFKTSVATSPMLGDLITINGEIRIQDKAPAPYVSALGEGSLFGAKLASTHTTLTLTRELEASFSTKVDTPLSAQEMSVSSEKHLRNPKFGIQVSEGVGNISKVALSINGSAQEVEITGSATMLGLEGSLRFTTSSLNDITPQRILEELLILKGIGLPKNYDFDLLSKTQKSEKAKKGETGNKQSSIPPSAQKTKNELPSTPVAFDEGIWGDAWREVTRYKRKCEDKIDGLGKVFGQDCKDIPYKVNEYMPAEDNLAGAIFSQLGHSPDATRNRLGMLKIRTDIALAAFIGTGQTGELFIFRRADLKLLWSGKFNVTKSFVRGPKPADQVARSISASEINGLKIAIHSITPESTRSENLLVYSSGASNDAQVAKAGENLDEISTLDTRRFHTETSKVILSLFNQDQTANPFINLLATDLIVESRKIVATPSNNKNLFCLNVNDSQFTILSDSLAIHDIKSQYTPDCKSQLTGFEAAINSMTKEHCEAPAVSLKNVCGTFVKTSNGRMMGLYKSRTSDEKGNAFHDLYLVPTELPPQKTRLYSTQGAFDSRMFIRGDKDDLWFKTMDSIHIGTSQIESVQISASPPLRYGMIYQSQAKRTIMYVDANLSCEGVGRQPIVLNAYWDDIQKYWKRNLTSLLAPEIDEETNDLTMERGGFSYLNTLLTGTWQQRGWQANPRAALEVNRCQ